MLGLLINQGHGSETSQHSQTFQNISPPRFFVLPHLSPPAFSNDTFFGGTRILVLTHPLFFGRWFFSHKKHQKNGNIFILKHLYSPKISLLELRRATALHSSKRWVNVRSPTMADIPVRMGIKKVASA